MKYVYLLHPRWYLSKDPLLSQALFVLKHNTYDPKVYININKDDSDRISMMVVMKIIMNLHKTKYIYINAFTDIKIQLPERA